MRRDVGLRGVGQQPRVGPGNAQILVDLLVHEVALEGIVAVHGFELGHIPSRGRRVHQRLPEAFRDDDHVAALPLGHGILERDRSVLQGHFLAAFSQEGGESLGKVAAVTVDDGKARPVPHELGVFGFAEREAACHEHAHEAEEHGVHEQVKGVTEHHPKGCLKDLHSVAS